MPVYEFRDIETGERREFAFEMRRAPDIGAQVAVNGRRYVRLPTRLRVQPTHDRHFSSRSLPRWWPYHDRHDAKTGRCLFSGQREVDEALARANHAGENVIYDDPGYK